MTLVLGIIHRESDVIKTKQMRYVMYPANHCDEYGCFIHQNHWDINCFSNSDDTLTCCVC